MSNEIEKRKGVEFPLYDGKKDIIVSMIEYKGVIYVATQHRLYYKKDGVMNPVLFINEIDENLKEETNEQ